ncbi:hypothetical protein [Mesorhizobium sp.]|uniref:hypothetical protein n=1 Tax=Mesorhizobium sp. TaxID=1871066 RepID=UPI00120A9958|nr:hypothetical protein [Mesorhizobium sp.]TIL64502.1 MAG: hypothetical protein E5Y77_26315 [Mesorhizobium sp.]
MEEQSTTVKDGVTHINWDVARKHRFAYNVVPPRPADWPPDVTPVSISGLVLIGIDEKTNELFWDGKRLITEKRFTDYERRLAAIGLFIAGVGVSATVVQAWAAVAALP